MENETGREAEIFLRFAAGCGLREARQEIFDLRGRGEIRHRPDNLS